MRQRTEKERLKGVRTSYLGSELYLTLVDSQQAPYRSDLDQIAVNAMVTNRDLPLLLPTGGKDVFYRPKAGLWRISRRRSVQRGPRLRWRRAIRLGV